MLFGSCHLFYQFKRQKSCVFLGRTHWTPEQIMLKLKLTQDNVRAAFFKVSFQGLRGKTDAKVKQTSAKDWISSSLEPVLLNTEKNVLKQTRANVWIAVLLKNPSMFPPFPYNSLEMFFPFPKTKIIPSKCFNCIHSDLSYTSCLLSDRRPIGQQDVVFATTDSIGLQDNEHLGKHTQ